MTFHPVNATMKHGEPQSQDEREARAATRRATIERQAAEEAATSKAKAAAKEKERVAKCDAAQEGKPRPLALQSPA